MTGEMIPVHLQLVDGYEYIGLVVKDEWREDKPFWLRVERVVIVQFIPQEDGTFRVEMNNITTRSTYMGWIDLPKGMIKSVRECDTQGQLYKGYQNIVSNLVLPDTDVIPFGRRN
jgi:hypothetical protein